jgi:hypothetical protein
MASADFTWFIVVKYIFKIVVLVIRERLLLFSLLLTAIILTCNTLPNPGNLRVSEEP